MNYQLLVAGVFWAEYSYISKRVVQLLGSPKNWPTHEPCCAPPQKIPFINAVQPFYGCQRNVRKNITVTVSVRVSVTFRVSLVWFVSGNNLVALCITIWWTKYITLLQIRGHSRFTKQRSRNSGHSKYTKKTAHENLGGIADSRKYAPEIRGIASA